MGIFSKSKKAKTGREISEKSNTEVEHGKSKVACPKRKKGSIVALLKRSDLKKLDHDATVELQKPSGTTIATKKDNRKVKFTGLDPDTYWVKASLSAKDADTGYTMQPADSLQSAGVISAQETLVIVPVQRPGDLTILVAAKDTGLFMQKVKVALAGTAARNDTADKQGSMVFRLCKDGPYTPTLTLTNEFTTDYALPASFPQIDMPVGTNHSVTLQVPRKPSPKIEIADPKVVIVKQTYHGKPKPGVPVHRIPVTLSSTHDFDGEGVLTCAPDDIQVYEKADGVNPIPAPWIVPKDDLGGKTVYIEAKRASASNSGTTLRFELRNGTIPAKPAVTETVTCVKLTLNICKSRPADGGNPVKLDDGPKLDPGRAVLLQQKRGDLYYAERAKLVLLKAQPADFSGKLVLEAISTAVELFTSAQEKPAASQTALAGAQLQFPNTDIDAANGKTFWVEGRTTSGAISDTGFKVGVVGVDNAEGDRVTMSVIEAELVIHKSRSVIKASGDPDAFSDGDKLDKARYLHKQNGKGHHGRGMITVKKIKPDGFIGKVFFTTWKVGYAPAYSESIVKADPSVKIFEEEDAAGATQTAVAFDSDIDHPATFPVKGKRYWVEGAKTSAELRDVQIRLGVRDIDKGCDRANFTVVRFKQLKADIPSTPANTVRNIQTGKGSNSPVTRHELKMADPAPADKDCSELFSENEPLVLVEGSVKDSDQIKLSVVVEPAGKKVPVKWSVQRFSHKAHGEGDPDAIINLPNNSNDPGLTADGGDVLKATLKVDAAGSFHVRPFIDCNDDDLFNHNDVNGVRIDREPFLIMNLQLIRVEGMSNLSSGKDDAGTNGTRKTMRALGPPFGNKNVPVQISTGNQPWTNGQCAITMRNIARVIGGGSDGKRGLDKLFSGWCNNMQNTATSPTGAGLDITHVYTKGTPAVLHTTACWFEVDGVRIPAPILDAGAYGPANTEGTGGNTACGTNGTNDCPVTKLDHASGIGQSWEVTNVDAPGFGINPMHPTVAGARLAEFRFNIDFRCDFIFWTNNKGVSDNTNAPACRLYSTVSTNYWTVRFEATYDAAFAETVVFGPQNRVAKDRRRDTQGDASGR